MNIERIDRRKFVRLIAGAGAAGVLSTITPDRGLAQQVTPTPQTTEVEPNRIELTHEAKVKIVAVLSIPILAASGLIIAVRLLMRRI